MMRTVRPVVVFALMALQAGCGHQTQNDRALTEPPPCNPEQARPISETTLKAVLARSGIHLYRDDRCEEFRNPDEPPPDPKATPRNPNAPQATLRNTRNSLDYDRVVSTEGDIFCELYRGGPLEPSQRRVTRLRRIKYEGDEETHLGIFNVACAIYPESPDQIDRLAAALLHLRRAKE
jgi:hypothetical protein